MKVDILCNVCVTVGGNQCQVIIMFTAVLNLNGIYYNEIITDKTSGN